METWCPVCLEKGKRYALSAHQINYKEAFVLCANATCLYPLISEKPVILKRTFDSMCGKTGEGSTLMSDLNSLKEETASFKNGFVPSMNEDTEEASGLDGIDFEAELNKFIGDCERDLNFSVTSSGVCSSQAIVNEQEKHDTSASDPVCSLECIDRPKPYYPPFEFTNKGKNASKGKQKKVRAPKMNVRKTNAP